MTLKLLWRFAPELYIFGAIIYYWILTKNILNPFAIVLLLVLSYQFFAKKAILGLLFAIIFMLLNIYMVLALLSELSEFDTASGAYYELLVIGSLFLGFNILMASLMFFKNKNKLTKTVTG